MDTSFGPGLYYKHSGKFFAGGALVAILVGLLVGLPCAWLYAWLIHWNPFIYIDALAALGFGGIIGIVIESSLESHKCRSVPVAGLAALLVVLVAYYVSWAVWLHALLDIPSTALMLHPAAMWQNILFVNEHGAWRLRGSDLVTGIPLWIAWGLEAAFIVGAAVLTAVSSMQQASYCEGCDRFAKLSKGVCYTGAGKAPAIEEKAAFKSYLKGLKQHASELKPHLEVKDFSYVEQLGAVQPEAIAWYQFDLTSCPQCNMTNTLRVTQVQSKIEGKKIKSETTQSEVLRQLLLSSTEADVLRKLGEKLLPTLPTLVAERAQAQKAAAAGTGAKS